MNHNTRRTVNVDLIQDFIDISAPLGLEKLSLASGVSSHLLNKIKNKNRIFVPQKIGTMIQIAKAIGKDIDEVFPVVGNDVNSAS